ncbi:MAG: hypothetical protein AB7L41_13415 [Flavobacteriaceae bacterium]
MNRIAAAAILAVLPAAFAVATPALAWHHNSYANFIQPSDDVYGRTNMGMRVSIANADISCDRVTGVRLHDRTGTGTRAGFFRPARVTVEVAPSYCSERFGNTLDFVVPGPVDTDIIDVEVRRGGRTVHREKIAVEPSPAS